MLAVERHGRHDRPGDRPGFLGPLVLAPVAIGVLAGIRLAALGPLAAAGLGYAAFAAAQVVATIWLYAATCQKGARRYQPRDPAAHP